LFAGERKPGNSPLLDGKLPYRATPSKNIVSFGAYRYLANQSGAATVAAKAKTGIAGLVDRALQQEGLYEPHLSR